MSEHVGTRASELLDGRLTAGAELEVRTHLGRCASCAAVVHREQQVRAMLRAAACQAPTPRGDLMAGLMALAATSPTPLADPVPAFVPTSATPGTTPGTAPRRTRPSVLTAAVLGSVSLTAAGAIGVGIVAQGAVSGVVAPVRQEGAVAGSTASFVQPAVAVLRGAATTSSHSGIRVVDAGAATNP